MLISNKFIFWAGRLLVGMLRGRIVQSNDKCIKIGILGNICTLISKQSGPSLDIAQEGRYLQSEMADIENVNFSNDIK